MCNESKRERNKNWSSRREEKRRDIITDSKEAAPNEAAWKA